MALIMCHVARNPSIIHSYNSMQFRAPRHFFKDFLTFKKFFWVKLRHSDVSNSLAFKNHHLHHCFQKLIKSSFFFFKTHSFMFQTRGIRPWLSHFQKRKKKSSSSVQKKKKKIIITKIFKNHAFILN